MEPFNNNEPDEILKVLHCSEILEVIDYEKLENALSNIDYDVWSGTWQNTILKLLLMTQKCKEKTEDFLKRQHIFNDKYIRSMEEIEESNKDIEYACLKEDNLDKTKSEVTSKQMKEITNDSSLNMESEKEKTNLNDTLDEMNLLLELGENYMNRRSIITKKLLNKQSVFEKITTAKLQTVALQEVEEIKKPFESKIPTQIKTKRKNTIYEQIARLKPNKEMISKKSEKAVFKHTDKNNKDLRRLKSASSLKKDKTTTSQYSSKPTSSRCLQTPKVSSSVAHYIKQNSETIPKVKHNLVSSSRINRFKQQASSQVKPQNKKSYYYKDIESPLAIYINHARNTPRTKNVKSQTIHRKISFKEDFNPDNFPEKPIPCSIPIQTYKTPAKTLFLYKESELKIPKNVRKLIKGPTQPEVIKHLGRIANVEDEECEIETGYKEEIIILPDSTVKIEGETFLCISKEASKDDLSQE